MSDPEGIFEDSLLSLFDHRPIAFSTAPDQPYVYTPTAIPGHAGADDVPCRDLVIRVHLPIAPSALHTTLQLTHIWLSSILLADLVASGVITVRGARICELGAGAGLPGIVAALRGARAVTSTDYAVQEGDVLDVLRGNFRRSVVTDGAEGDTWQVLGHTWGEPVNDILGSCMRSTHGTRRTEKYSILFLADLLWTTAAHAALITSILDLLCPTGIAHVVAGLHQGRGAVERFKHAWLDRTAGRGGWIRDMMDVQWGLDGWELLRDYRRDEGMRRGGDEHGTVVYFTLGLGDA